MPGQINIINTKFPFVVGGVGQYTSIQTAITDAAVVANSNNIQSVLVNPGTYNENIVLHDFVNLCSFGSTVESAIIVGNASYPSLNASGIVSVSGITFQTPGIGGDAFNISATNGSPSTIYFNNCNFVGSAGNCFVSNTASANANIFMNNINMNASAGFNAFDFSNIPSFFISIGNINIVGVDTASNIDGVNMTMIGVNIVNSFTVTNAILEIGNGFFGGISTLPLMDIDINSTGILTSVITQVGSTYTVAGTGVFLYSDVATTAGFDPGLAIDSSYSTYFEQIQLNVPLDGSNGGTGVANTGLTIDLVTGASSSKVLTSDNSGNATWQAVSSSGAVIEIDGDSGSMTPTAGVVTISGGTTGLTTSAATDTMDLTGILIGDNGGTGIANTGLTIDLSSGSIGLVLTSDVSGNGSWQSPSASGIVTITADDSGTITGSNVTISGGTTGLTTTTTSATEMDLTGTLIGDNGGTGVANTGLTIDLVTGAASSKVLTSDNSGNATWQAPAAGITTIQGDDAVALTGSTISIITNVASNHSGATLSFTGSGSTLTLNTSDSSNNTFIGNTSGNTSVSGSNNIGLGTISLQHLTSGNGNVCIGVNSGNSMTSSLGQIAIGQGALSASQADQDNIAVGTFSMSSTNGGTGNTGVGTLALSSNVNSSYNVGLGFQSLYHLTGGGGENFGLGGLSLTNLLTGANNIAVGFSSGFAYTTTESYNIVFNSQGIVGESNTLRLGSGTGTGGLQLNQAFISGIYGITTTSATTSTVIVSDGDQLGTIASSRRYKDNIVDIPESNFMKKIRPVQFNYKAHKTSDISYGFIAEEVLEVAPQLVNLDKEGKPESVKYHEMYALLLNEIQKAYIRIENLELKLKDKVWE